MSLLDDFAKKCVIMEKTRVPDGSGGYIVSWQDGAEFVNYYALNTSTEAIIAERQGISSIYHALIQKNVPLDYGEFFKDLSTGETYRVTSNPEDKEAPKMSNIQLKFFTAERKELPT